MYNNDPVIARKLQNEGSITTTYKIDSVNIANCDIMVNTSHADDPENPGDDPAWWEYYTGSAIEPKVTVTLGDYTLVECRLETGRTHQIRVHMNYIGFPLVGDPKYGPKKTIDFGGQVLHAGVLGFEHPVTGEYLEFSVPLPEDFEQLLQSLRK